MVLTVPSQTYSASTTPIATSACYHIRTNTVMPCTFVPVVHAMQGDCMPRCIVPSPRRFIRLDTVRRTKEQACVRLCLCHVEWRETCLIHLTGPHSL